MTARLILVVGGAATVAALALVVGLDGGRIRDNADSEATVSVVGVWIPALVVLLLTRLVPPRLAEFDPTAASEPGRIRREAVWLVGCAVAFAVLLGVAVALSGDLNDVVFLGAKAVLLIVVPLIVLRSGRWAGPYGGWFLIGPLIPVAAWFGLAWFGPWAAPYEGPALATDLVGGLIAIVGGLLVNAVLEEIFYRMWLQTRLERLLGRWPAIMAVSLLWGSWHLALKWTGQPLHDLAGVLAYYVPFGFLLGYLWSRYRNPFAGIAIHAALNAPLAMLMTAG